jgi:hypothetical protein
MAEPYRDPHVTATPDRCTNALGDQRGTVMVINCVPDPQQVLVNVQWDGHTWQALQPEPEPADLFQFPEVGGETDPVAARQRSDPGGGPVEVMPSAAASGSPPASFSGPRSAWPG